MSSQQQQLSNDAVATVAGTTPRGPGCCSRAAARPDARPVRDRSEAGAHNRSARHKKPLRSVTRTGAGLNFVAQATDGLEQIIKTLPL